MSTQDPNRSPQPAQPSPARGSSAEPLPVSGRMLALFFAALAVALVVGYLFLNKLVDISREEDCALAHRYNCGAVEVPSNRQ
jgi:hypothetical protein